MAYSSKSGEYDFGVFWQFDLFDLFLHFHAISAFIRRFNGISTAFLSVGQQTVVTSYYSCITSETDDALVLLVFKYLVIDQLDFKIENSLQQSTVISCFLIVCEKNMNFFDGIKSSILTSFTPIMISQSCKSSTTSMPTCLYSSSLNARTLLV